MDMAHQVAMQSSSPTLKVGCVIVNDDWSKPESIGYNGGAKGLSNEVESMEPGQSGFIHAEINALIKSDYSLKNKIMFLTHSPCSVCAKAIINGDIGKLYFSELYRSIKGLEILNHSSVEVFWMGIDNKILRLKSGYFFWDNPHTLRISEPTLKLSEALSWQETNKPTQKQQSES